MEEEGEVNGKENVFPTTCIFPSLSLLHMFAFLTLYFTNILLLIICPSIMCANSHEIWSHCRFLLSSLDMSISCLFLCFLNSLQKKNWNFFLNNLMNPLSFPAFQILSCAFILAFIRTFWRLPSWLLYICLNIPFLSLALLSLKISQTHLHMVFVTFTLPIYLMARINLKNSSFPHCLFYLQHNLHRSIKRSLFRFIFL